MTEVGLSAAKIVIQPAKEREEASGGDLTRMSFVLPS